MTSRLSRSLDRRVPRTDAVIGSWWAACCLHDLYRVEVEDLKELLATEDPIAFCGVWLTLDDALRDLLPAEDMDSVKNWLDWRRQAYPEQQTEIEKALNRVRVLG